MRRRCLQLLQPDCCFQRPCVMCRWFALPDRRRRSSTCLDPLKCPQRSPLQPAADTSHGVTTSPSCRSLLPRHAMAVRTLMYVPDLLDASNAQTHPARRRVCGHASTRGNQAASRIAHPLEQPAVVQVPDQRCLCALWQRLQRNRGCVCLVQFQRVMRSLLRHCIRGHVCGVPIPCISCSDLMSVPEGLREVLETLFAEDASPDNLAIYLPKVCQIITNLLHGLCDKQSMYRRIVSEHQFHQRSSHSRTDSRSSRSDRTTSRREEETRHRSHCRRQARERGLRHVDRNRDSSIAPRASVRTSTKRPETQSCLTPPPFAEPNDDLPAASDHCPVSAHMHANGRTDCSPQPPQTRHSQPALQPSVHTSHDNSACASTGTIVSVSVA